MTRHHLAGRLSASVALMGASVAALAFSPPAVQAASPPPPAVIAPGGYGGYANGDIVGANAVTIPGTLQVADVHVAPVETEVSSLVPPGSITPAPKKNVYARAANADVNLLSGAIPLTGLLVEAKQSALPDNPKPNVQNLISVPADPLLDATVADATASARWLGAQCVPIGTPIAQATSDVATANVLPGSPIEVSVVNGGGGPVTSDSKVQLVKVAGQANEGLVSSQVDQITGVVLFKGTPNELTVNVLAPPQLTATATGQPGGAKVDYTEPILQILQGKTVLATLDAKSANTSITIPGLATLSLGQLTSTVSKDGTTATGQASLLTVAIGIAPLPLNVATISIAPAMVSATVPSGGVFCPPNTNPLDEAHKDASSSEVAPGQQFTYTVTVPNRGTCTLVNVKVVDTITAPPGTTVVSTNPPASTTNGLSVTWNDIGPLAPNDTKNLQILVQVPANLQDGAQLKNDATITAVCQGAAPGTTPFSKDIEVVAPRGFAPGFPGCHLSDSNKAADHIKVFDGETFNYYIHVFNDGTKSCSGVTVSDPVPANTTFVSASDGGTLSGGTVTWNLGTLASGASHTLVLTVKVNDKVPTGTVLPDNAHIASPSQPGPGTDVHAIGPTVTGISVLAPSNLPAASGTGKLPVTGGDNSRFAPLGLGLLAVAFGAWGWRRRVQRAI